MCAHARARERKLAGSEKIILANFSEPHYRGRVIVKKIPHDCKRGDVAQIVRKISGKTRAKITRSEIYTYIMLTLGVYAS